jgi:hypothetical protein
MNDIFFDVIFPILLMIGMVLWFYCIWFHSKYDKNSNKLVLLLFFNVYYIPFYLYRIKELKKENRIKALSEEIFDAKFIEQSRSGIIAVIEMWASSKDQLAYLQAEDEINIVEELFTQWDDYYRIDNKIIEEAFKDSEIEMLEAFDGSLLSSQSKLGAIFPELDEFQKTNDWNVINKQAIEILKEMK